MLQNNRLLLDKLVRIQSMSSRNTCKPPTERSTLRNSGGIVRDNATGAKLSDNINFHTCANKAGSLRTVRAAREAQEIQTMVRCLLLAADGCFQCVGCDVVLLQKLALAALLTGTATPSPNTLSIRMHICACCCHPRPTCS
jgi:hypothetical protein